MSSSHIWRKLMATFMVLGLINIILAFGFFYYSSTHLIEERAGQQMESVRALNSQKMISYFDTLKAQAIIASANPETHNIHSVRSFAVNPQGLDAFPDLQFSLYDSHDFILKVPVAGKKVVWIFNFSGLNEVLAQREGLGSTGEIYIVGEDKKLKSASRHVKGPGEIEVDNESTRLGKLNQTGVHIVKDYRGVEVLSSYSGFEFDRLKFVLLSEIDKEEVFSPLNKTFPLILILCGGLLLITIGASALSSKKILDLIQQMRAQINGLNFRILNAQEEEKRRIALDLHDGVGQSLTALRWSITGMQEWSEKKAKDFLLLCDEAISGIRNVSHDLMPSSLKELGCFSAIREYLKRQEHYLGIKIDFWHSQKLEELEFCEGLDVNMFRMIQELVQNSLKHGKATVMSLVILKQEENLVIRFEDNGPGMKEEETMPKTLSFRCDIMNGIMTRESQPGHMVFVITTPMKNVFV